MKKWMILAAAVVLAAPVFAQTQEAFPSYIQVNGRSQMEVTPDEFYLSIVINERESKGKITVETQQRQMIDALKKLGVDVEKQLKVANMSSDFYKKASSLTTAKYQLLLHSAAEVGDVTAALGDLGISNVGIVRVTRSDIDSLKEQVRLDAIHNAKSSAEALAGAIGQKIGKCFYIYDSNYDVAPQYYDNMMMVRSKAMMADSAEAGAPEEPSLDNERESKGKITVETQQRQMIDALKKLGVDVEKQLKVANMSSDFYKKASSLTTAKYQLLLHSAAEVGDVTAALGDLGISNVGIVRVTRSDIDSLKEQVRLDAIHNAKSSAEALAGAIGQKIGKCFYIYDSNYDVAPQYYDNMMMVRSKAMMADSAEAGAPEEPSLDFKTIKLEYNVQTKFVLE